MSSNTRLCSRFVPGTQGGSQSSAKWLTPHLPQDLIRNKARNRQTCALLEQAYAVVSALPRRAEDRLHVSLMENYPGTLEALGEPIRQVWARTWGG